MFILLIRAAASAGIFTVGMNISMMIVFNIIIIFQLLQNIGD